MTRARLGALGAAALALIALAWVRGGGGGPSLYDGICQPPSYALFGAHPPPSSAMATYGTAELASTQELATPPATAPQAQVIVGSSTLAAAPGAASVTVTITAVKPPGVSPPNGTIIGNVYEFAATSGGRPVAPAADHPVTVALESTSAGGPTLTLERFDGTGWTALKTFQSGCGTTYDAASPSLGLFALVAPGGPGQPPGTPGPAGSGPPVLALVAGAVVVLGLVIVAIRVARRRR